MSNAPSPPNQGTVSVTTDPMSAAAPVRAPEPSPDLSLLDTGPLGEAETVAGIGSVLSPGMTIGPWVITGELGRGGMGAVYRAIRADREFQIQVAIKVVSPGVNSALVLERFRTERQILARLDHPFIARLLDGGTTAAGLPYFVMEYVDGEPLNRYCDQHRLSVAERLKLFRKVCDAVSYAHQGLVLHRDLKPGNILVTPDGTPKLLDFGIAKLLDPTGTTGTAEPTMTLVRMGTPAYSSPEQIRGQHAGIPADVYSLGVILYELLTGARPYSIESLGWEESARIICEMEPARASTATRTLTKVEDGADAAEVSGRRGATPEGLRKRLRGDLDNIIGMALRKEPLRRYRSVDQFSEDLQRHLDGRPVMARADSAAYRARKFARRHWFGVAAGVLFTLVVTAAAILFGWQNARLSRRVDADQALASSFLVDIHDAIAKLPGSTPAREMLVARSLEYLNGLARDAGDDQDMNAYLALGYEKFAELQAGVNSAGLGKSAAALETYRKSQALREAMVRSLPRDRKAQYDLAGNYLLGAFVAGRAGGADSVLRYDQKAVTLSESLVQAEPGNHDYQVLLGKAYMGMAYGETLFERWSNADVYFEKASKIRERLAAAEPGNLELQRDLASTYYRAGVIHVQSGQPASALPDLTSAFNIQQSLLAREKDNEHVRADIASTHHFLGVALGALGQTEEALAHFQEAIAIRERMAAADARDARTRLMLAGNYAERGTVLLRAGRRQDGIASLQHGVELQRQVLELDPHGVPPRVSMADFEGRLGAAYESAGQWRDATAHWNAAVALYDALDREGRLGTATAKRDADHARAEAKRCAEALALPK